MLVYSDASFFVVFEEEIPPMRRNGYQTRWIGIMSQEPWIKIYVHIYIHTHTHKQKLNHKGGKFSYFSQVIKMS